MMMVLSWWPVVLVSMLCMIALTSGEACYEPFGCFPITSDFEDPEHRPINVEPEAPSIINTQFYLYAKWLQESSVEEICGHVAVPLKNDSQYDPCLITTEQLMNHSELTNKLDQIASQLSTSRNDSSHPWLAVVAHGYIDGPRATSWMTKLKNLLLNQNSERPYDVVVLVDWTGGNRNSYTQATANIRLVGVEIAYFLRQLTQHLNRTNDQIHVIGHSLGTHLVSYAAKNFTDHKLGRLTALDPAGPSFKGMPSSVRVAPDDAQFVDAIHTNGKTTHFIKEYGTLEPMAQLDFYPNGARDQPGCIEVSGKPPKELDDVFMGSYGTVCNHARAILFFMHSIPKSINNPKGYCPYHSVKCPNWPMYQHGKCGSTDDCAGDSATCPSMGFFAYRVQSNQTDESTKLYLETEGQAPYCSLQ